MKLVPSATVIEGLGIEGDKHASAASKRQVLLADKEALDAVGVLAGTIKENVTVEGVDVMRLPSDLKEISMPRPRPSGRCCWPTRRRSTRLASWPARSRRTSRSKAWM